jgi:hypothetical protein
MNILKNNDESPRQYETMPEHYLLCFNDECEQENSKLTELQSLLLAKMGQ